MPRLETGTSSTTPRARVPAIVPAFRRVRHFVRGKEPVRPDPPIVPTTTQAVEAEKVFECALAQPYALAIATIVVRCSCGRNQRIIASMDTTILRAGSCGCSLWSLTSRPNCSSDDGRDLQPYPRVRGRVTLFPYQRDRAAATGPRAAIGTRSDFLTDSDSDPDPASTNIPSRPTSLTFSFPALHFAYRDPLPVSSVIRASGVHTRRSIGLQPWRYRRCKLDRALDWLPLVDRRSTTAAVASKPPLASHRRASEVGPAKMRLSVIEMTTWRAPSSPLRLLRMFSSTIVTYGLLEAIPAHTQVGSNMDMNVVHLSRLSRRSVSCPRIVNTSFSQSRALTDYLRPPANTWRPIAGSCGYYRIPTVDHTQSSESCAQRRYAHTRLRSHIDTSGPSLPLWTSGFSSRVVSAHRVPPSRPLLLHQGPAETAFPLHSAQSSDLGCQQQRANASSRTANYVRVQQLRPSTSSTIAKTPDDSTRAPSPSLSSV
ncbi:hypothetical protein C8Q76DRAFT_802902 [Earliella scabrosa]|nr:hypothetical protein C8Q76DRAFT_802902 [Earliella scabrosa]